MKNKFYNVIITSDHNNFGKSYRLSTKLLILLVFFGITVFGLSIIGFIRILNQDELTNNIKNLKVINFNLKNKLFALDSNNTEENSIHLVTPVEGYVSKGVNINNDHNGIDIASVKGNPIKAASDGLVIFSGIYGNMGKTLVLSHLNNIFTIYGHNDSNLVEVREFVSAGDHIANVGSTGISDGPHLHFEVWKGNEIIDPRKLIKEYNNKDVSIKKSR